MTACAHPESVTAVTIAQPSTVPTTPPVDLTGLRVEEARAQIDAHHFDEASTSLIAIVCPSAQTDLQKCGPPATGAGAEAWALIGQLAVERKLVTTSYGWMGARHVVDRWSHTKNDSLLAVAELAYSRATSFPSRDERAWLIALGTVRASRGHHEDALRTFIKILDRRAETAGALEGAAASVAHKDWDGDNVDDAVHGFARPEVARLLARDAPYLPSVYAQAIQKMAETGECDDARAGLMEMKHRFAASPAMSRAESIIVSDCP
jgi:hypothetical protein